MVFEIVPAILEKPKCRHARFSHGRDVGLGTVVDNVQQVGTGARKNRQHGPKQGHRRLGDLPLKSQRMSRAGIAFYRGHMVAELAAVGLGISGLTTAGVLFIHPGDDTNGSFGMQIELVNQVRGFHSYSDAGGIVDGATAQVPGIQVTGNHDNLLRMFRTLDIGDNVVAQNRRSGLRRQN